MGLRPTQDDEKRIGPATTLSLPLPSPCHPDRSEAKRRDLRFYGPFLDMFFDGAKRLTDLSRDTALGREVEGPRRCLTCPCRSSLSTAEARGRDLPAVRTGCDEF